MAMICSICGSTIVDDLCPRCEGEQPDEVVEPEPEVEVALERRVAALESILVRMIEANVERRAEQIDELGEAVFCMLDVLDTLEAWRQRTDEARKRRAEVVVAMREELDNVRGRLDTLESPISYPHKGGN